MAAWDHTADMMAMYATIHTSNQYQRDHFHPYREKPPTPQQDVDDPGAEYERLIALERKAKGIK